MWRATLKGLLAHKGRLIATATAVLLGVAFMAGTMVLTDTVASTFDDLFADVYEGTDALVRSSSKVAAGEGGFEDSRARIDSALVEQVLEIDGVAAADGQVQGFAQIVDEDGEPLGDPGMGPPTFGFDWTDIDELNPFVLFDGRAPKAADEVVVDRASAKRAELEVGDVATVLVKSGPVRFKVVGVATFGRVDSPGGATVAMFEDAAAQQLVGEPGRYSSIATVAAEGVSEEELRDRLAAALPDGVEVLTGSELVSETQDDIREGISFFGSFLLAFALVALFVGSFLIHNTFSIVVAQRGRELALMRSLGATRRQVIRSVLVEALIVGVLASAAGILVGIAVAAGLKALLAGFGIDIPAGGVVITVNTVLVAMITGTVVTLIASLTPAIRASRIPPVAALRDLAVDTSAGSRVRLVAGALVTIAGGAALIAGLFASEISAVGLGAALVFVGVAVLGPMIARPVSRILGSPVARLRGITGSLARENAVRSPKRTAATASALMVGVGLVGFITVFGSSARASIEKAVDDAFRADLVIDSGSFGVGGLSPSLAERLRDLPEVDLAVSLRSANFEIESDGQFALAADPRTVDEVFDLGVVDGSLDQVAETSGIAVHEDAAKKRGWAVGDDVPVRFAETGEQRLTIGAIYEEDTLGGSYFMSLGAAEANIPDQYDLMVHVTFADGAVTEEARAAVERVAGGYPGAEVQDRTEFKEAQASQLSQLLNLIYALLALALIIALIGIANTLALSILERTREIGLLRAVGMTRGQVRSSVRWESLLIALLGTFLGLAIGLFFSWALAQALKDEGLDQFNVPIGPLVTIVIAGGILGVVAGIGPARRAAKLDVLRAVTVE